ncbi:MAG: FxSxx-COOH system tetratricopeptide repeat protein [Solirubrobacteraceae bacterium]
MAASERNVELIRVVVLSPGDVAEERATVAVVVDELNRRVARSHGCLLSLWRWETDARAGLHIAGPQGLIDERMEIGESDIAIGIFWWRFGTPTGDARSGTEHELRRAWEAWRENHRPDVMVYFCEREGFPASKAEAEQLMQVMAFREELPREQLWWSYTTPVEFERLVRGHLEDVIVRRAARTTPPAPVTGRGAPVGFNLPLVPRLFVGRTRELAALEEALQVADRAVVTQAITGLGGVGKSRLAEHYVAAHADEYDVVAWIRAQDGGVADLAELAAALGEPVDGLSPAEARELALLRLGRGQERWLLVLDNLDSPAQLAGCLPRGGGGRVLVTSRDREVRQFAPALSLDVFDEQTAVDYLIERADRPRDRDGARRLAQALGGLPLALTHAAAYCADSADSFDDYLQLLGALPAQELFTSRPEPSYEQTVASTWRASIAAASARAPRAGDALALAAHLGPDAIPRSLFGVLIDPEQPGERMRLATALGALARASLATVDDETVSVHRLLQKVVRDDARARGDQTPITRALAALDQAFPADPADPSRWPHSECLLSHVIALADGAAQLGDAVSRLIGLLNRACTYLIWAGDGARGLALARRSAAAAEHTLGRDHRETLTARYWTAVALRQTGRAEEAMACCESLVADQERILGARDPDTLRSRNHLATVLRAAGRVTEAIAILDPLVADSAQILGIEHPETLTTRHNLGLAYRADGRASEAIVILESLRADYTRIRGAEQLETLTTLNNLALAYRDVGRMAEAIAIFEALRADRVRILGAEHPDTLTSRGNLASTYQAAHDIAAAILILEPLVADFMRILGADHPHTLTTRHNLAVCYRAAGRAADAVAILEPLLADSARILGPGHPGTLTTRRSLAAAYRAGGREAEADTLAPPVRRRERR